MSQKNAFLRCSAVRIVHATLVRATPSSRPSRNQVGPVMVPPLSILVTPVARLSLNKRWRMALVLKLRKPLSTELL